jgi:hypothetical protein
MNREQQLKELLEETRERIRTLTNDDPDEWFYANRYVFSRLSLDERKTKTGIKKALAPCDFCGKVFEIRKDIHIHRRDGERGYSSENCVLMHPECHQKHHKESPKEAWIKSDVTSDGIFSSKFRTKRSCYYSDRKFHYWWDISPNHLDRYKNETGIRFLRDDSDVFTNIEFDILRPFLVDARKTSRGKGNWGVRVLNDRPDELAFEPPAGSKDWMYLPVKWESARKQ